MIFLSLESASINSVCQFCDSEPVGFFSKTVQIGWLCEFSVLIKVTEDILKIIWELESLKNNFSRISYEF